VKSFVTDQGVINLALSSVGKAKESEVSVADASSVSGKRIETIEEAIEDVRSKSSLTDSEAA
jgi:hypothetical protein